MVVEAFASISVVLKWVLLIGLPIVGGILLARIAGIDLAQVFMHVIRLIVDASQRMIQLAPAPVRWLVFVVAGLAVVGMLMNFVIGMNKVCVDGDVYETSFFEAQMLKSTSDVLTPGVFTISQSGLFKEDVLGVSSFGTWFVTREDGRVFLAVPADEEINNATAWFNRFVWNRVDLTVCRARAPPYACSLEYTCSFWTGGEPIKKIQYRTEVAERDGREFPVVQIQYSDVLGMGTLASACSVVSEDTIAMSPGDVSLVLEPEAVSIQTAPYQVYVNDTSTGYMENVRYIDLSDEFAKTINISSGKTERQVLFDELNAEGGGAVPATYVQGDAVRFICEEDSSLGLRVLGMDIFDIKTLILLSVVFLLFWALLKWR